MGVAPSAWSQLYTFDGQAPGDSLGNSVSGAGDVNNDGSDELIVGAPRNDAGGYTAGRAYVYSCPTNDLGTPDTLYVETFDCDHVYNRAGVYDSVRVAIYVTHDSNTFCYEGENKWVQDSIAAFVIPLKFWDFPLGPADSVVLPTYDNWNNTVIDPADPKISRSVFRNLVDAHTSDTVYNRMLNLKWDTRVLDIESPYESDSGHAWFGLISAITNKKWYEGSKELLATLTFLVYMPSPEPGPTAEICLDSMSAPPVWELYFTRYDVQGYVPRAFLPVCDTIFIPAFIRGDANGDGQVNLADAVYIVNYLFIGGPPPDPFEAGDANGSGDVDLADAVYIINYLFIGGPPPGC